MKGFARAYSIIQELIYGLLFLILFIGALTAIHIAHLVIRHCFSKEIFLLTSNLISVIVGAFFGAKL